MKTTLATASMGVLMMAFATPAQEVKAQSAETPPAKAAPAKAVRATGYSAVRTSTGFVLEPGEHEIADLIDQVGEFLGYNILSNPSELQSQGAGGARFRITKRIEVDAKGCWELFGSLLYHKGFAIVPLDPDKGFWQVIAMNGPRRAEINVGARFVPTEKIRDYADQRATPILTTVPLEHINATVATNALRPFFAAGGAGMATVTIGNVGNNKAILLQGFGPQVNAAYQLLKLTDVPQVGPELLVRVVRLEHAMAEEVAARLQDVFRPNQGMQPGGASYAGQFSLLKVATQPSLNALLLSGTEEQIGSALNLIARLDIPAPESRPASADLEAKVNALEKRIQQLEKAAKGRVLDR